MLKIFHWIFPVLIFNNIYGALGETWEDLQNHTAWSILDAFDCGENVADRIIGGQDAALGQLPWIVRLGYVSTDNETDWMCGGALITDRHVVTAAHCSILNPWDEFKLSFVRLGEYDTRTDPDCRLGVCAPPIQDRAVKQELITTHKLFNKPAFHNDIAVIKLDKPAILNDYLTPVCLPRKEQLQQLALGEMLTVAGWGKMNMSTDERAEVLQYVNLPIVEPAVCESITARGFNMTSAEICAGAQVNKDACGGDSGGPLMKVFDTPEGPKNYLLGVVSFGPTICGVKKPGVYASISHYLKWLLDTILL